MNVPQYASAAARLLRRFLPNSQTIEGDRERGIATLERALRARARRRRWQWLGAGLVAAASLPLALGLGRWRAAAGHVKGVTGDRGQISIQGSPSGRGAALSSGARAQPLAERAELAAGQRIETPEGGGASFKLSTGTSMDLSDSSSFRVDSQGATEHFTLERGRLSAHVEKLALGQRFIVATPDAEIEVRGTRFRIQVLEHGETCGAGSRSRLQVSEGVVEVRAAGETTSVRAGQRWPADCDPSMPGLAQVVPNELPFVSVRPRMPVPARPALAAVARPAEPSSADSASTSALGNSTLSAVNDLFAEGVALRRRGDSEGALRAYQAVIARFPSSPLSENALAERMRILAGKRDPRARHEAELYLSRYPKGFAAGEARALTVAP